MGKDFMNLFLERDIWRPKGEAAPRTRDPIDIEEERRLSEEEALEDAKSFSATDECCASCGDRLHYTEEVTQMTICRAYTTGSEVVITPYLDEEGGFLYEPHFLEFDCWESLVEDLREALEDSPPVQHYAEILKCSYCKGSICEWELFATAYVGELWVSKRSPSGVPTSTFETMSSPYLSCLSCLLIQSYELDLWDEHLSQIGECEECSHARCWRPGPSGRTPACPCPCHHQEPA